MSGTVGLAVLIFDEPGWRAMQLASADDVGEYDDYLVEVEGHCRELAARGFHVHRVDVDAVDLIEWCNEILAAVVTEGAARVSGIAIASARGGAAAGPLPCPESPGAPPFKHWENVMAVLLSPSEAEAAAAQLAARENAGLPYDSLTEAQKARYRAPGAWPRAGGRRRRQRRGRC